MPLFLADFAACFLVSKVFAAIMWFHIRDFVGIVAVDAVMVIAGFNSVVKEDRVSELEVH